VYGGRGEYVDVDEVKPAAETEIVELRMVVGDCVKVEIKDVVDGAFDGDVKGVVDVAVDGDVKGVVDGAVDGDVKGAVDGAVDGIVDGGIESVVAGLTVVVGAWEVLKGSVVEVGVDSARVVDWNVWVSGGVVAEIIICVDAVDEAAELKVVRVVELSDAGKHNDSILFASADA
jgi:hypothetical protein